MTTPRGPLSERPILIGYMVLDGWAEDYSDWDGVITGPENPKGANLYWHDPIEMIEKRAYDAALARAEKAEAAHRMFQESYAFERERIVGQLLSAEAQVVALRGALEFIANGCLVPPDGGSPQHPEDCMAAAKEALSLPVPELAQAVQGVIDTVRLIAGPIEFYCAVGERSQQAAAQAALSRLDAAMGSKP